MKRLLLIAMLISAGTQAGQAAPSGGNAYFFGDSLTDCCNYGRTTTGMNWSDLLPPLIGKSYTASQSSNYAFGGAQSGSALAKDFLSQVARFTASGTVVNPNDTVGLWIGTNDVWGSSYGPNDRLAGSEVVGPIGRQPDVDTLTNYIMGNIRTGVSQLAADGVRNVVLLSPIDLGQSAVEPNAAAASLATTYSTALTNAERVFLMPGVNVFFVDVEQLFDQVEADPAAYGFQHPLASDNCLANNCQTQPQSVQNSYVFEDILHLTTGFDTLIAARAAAVVNAGQVTVPEPCSLAALAGMVGSVLVTRRRRLPRLRLR